MKCGKQCVPVQAYCPRCGTDLAYSIPTNLRGTRNKAPSRECQNTNAAFPGHFAKHYSNLLDDLATQIATALTGSNSLSLTKSILADTNAAGFLIEFPFQDYKTAHLLIRLALIADCLNRASEAVLADSIVEEEELRLVHVVFGSAISFYAHMLDSYADFEDISDTTISAFLHQFSNDDNWFGGGHNKPCNMIGAHLCLAAAVIAGDDIIINKYSSIIERTMTIIMKDKNDGKVNALEYRTIQIVAEFHASLQQCVTQYNVAGRHREQFDSGDSVDRSQDKPTLGPAGLGATSEPENTLREATSELERLVGLAEVKSEVRRLMNFLTIQRERKKHGLHASSQSLHFVFTGNPGTGKTTVARILSRILFGFGLLKHPKLVECDRATLVGGFLGQTAIKTDEVIQSALDGVLFIDEAYTLARDASRYGHADQYGEEAIGTLLKRMEDYRDRLIVIAAGYPKPMQEFIDANPGLQSRFTKFIFFDDYSVPQLCRIFDSMCRQHEYSLTPNACATLLNQIRSACANRNEKFGNARFVRTLFERVTSYHADRIAQCPDVPSKAALITIDGADIPVDSVSDYSALGTEKFRGACPWCGYSSKASVKCLGQRVSCKCGKSFIFPWWCPVETSEAVGPTEVAGADLADILGVTA